MLAMFDQTKIVADGLMSTFSVGKNEEDSRNDMSSEYLPESLVGLCGLRRG